MKLYRIILFLLITGTLSVFGQSDFLKGELIDASTIEPVAFATIAVKGRAVGVISNADGSFQVPQKFNVYGDTLQISSMGYEKREILISTLSIDVPRRIYLQPRLFNLDEAIVRAKKKRTLSARKIVRRAIENIPKNYPFQPFSTVGYYRDYQLRENRYINLNEAMLEVFDSGFGKLDSTTTKVQIYQYKRNDDFERDTLADDPYDYKSLRKTIDNAYLFNYGGNEFTILRVHDAIRNYNVNAYSFVNRFDLDLLKNHDFSKGNSTHLGGEALYTIKFRKTYPNYSAFGTLYISYGDYAIHKMEYAVYDNRKRYPHKIVNKHKSSGQLLFEVVTEYQRQGGRMYPNYISFHNSFILWEPPVFRAKFIAADLSRRCFVVEFTNEPDNDEAVDYSNYTIVYKGQRISLKSSLKFNNKVFLFPKMKLKKEIEMFKEISRAKKDDKILKNLFEIKIKKMKDVEGNVLNKWTKGNYDQLREFFVQRVKPSTSIPDDNLFMDNGKPIFKNQPLVRPDNFDDYWMNTPLQKLYNQKPDEQ